MLIIIRSQDVIDIYTGCFDKKFVHEQWNLELGMRNFIINSLLMGDGRDF